ncbi:flagellar basal-body rod protein FlgF [Bradyrhizobium sp. U87765 SZCCT0131]|uniref:flagellar basal-body rod protein FlgF n=1 Tax=unclassified Bradyrhizobium TaxID=2631580 RepID=UPI001BA57A81|nr:MULTISPECIES: flagellar basal-body rod protein FlgF [unclassified Bradyrhizobium]MBR1219759.1 flagellar basal-body rod protein FlgF [Bradyrhizobium sp. U87765 SZCCT0131]MBR1262410.1 flagellar basal-body rod protein FlgF [Bradyrhizobium sp. U87765 SZCCT0134]MBR1308407.1 flagellar basal-body rod protein FlgF [Bradyrhizobium sp. U87765 SZCCT0110]MBR1318192.1 flagellar basal-body rod protein FlgF [Bradyrhizobium sp. U87765 SZCCT0109]MBR1351895.1 flagellar basal-body rod protein FlgF [Bradyrhizo
MENTLLIGLSRQMTLERQIDVISNNVANMNTTGFKADNSRFQEYMMPVARADNFVGRDRQLSYVQDTASWRDYSGGPNERTDNPLNVAIDGNGFLAVQTPAGERYTRNGELQINAQGQLVTADGNLVLGTGGPITFQPTDHDIVISDTGIVTVVEGANSKTDSIRGKLRLVNFAQMDQLQKEGTNLYSAPNGTPAQADPTSRIRQGYLERSNVNAVREMSRLVEVTRTYQNVSAILQQQGDLRKSSLDKLADVPS